MGCRPAVGLVPDLAWEAAYVAAGGEPGRLRLRYPAHQVGARDEVLPGRLWCGMADAAWTETGLGGADAARWSAAGVPPCCAGRFTKFGLDGEETAGWLAVGVDDPRRAAEWKACGFAPPAASPWAARGVGPGAAAVAAGAGLHVRSLLPWSWVWRTRRDGSADRRARVAGPSAADVDQVLAWQAAGLGPRSARLWHRAEYTPQEALS
ncbi:MAG: hypothetical protein LC789_14505 [Actinobacteria bacterium]|nr:hypothetical protein [Actinomycetota bacterium]MCA1721318.1 hypothetical protein [Actinomycetota bacterium]